MKKVPFTQLLHIAGTTTHHCHAEHICRIICLWNCYYTYFFHLVLL